VPECDAELSAVATEPGDEACRELLRVESSFFGRIVDEPAFFRQMIAARRLVVRLRVRGVHGVLLDKPPGA
jgi:hypothetical protein